MNKEDLIPHIRKCWMYAKALKIDEIFSGPVALEASDDFKSASSDANSTYEDVYLVGMRDSQYNILLRDYSFFQFGMGGRDGVRFAYYPNPFLGQATETLSELGELREYVSEGILEVEDFLHRVSEIRHHRQPPMMRYEYSLSQYVENSHPCSHIHLGFHGENRLPVKRYLTAHGFCLLIFRLFYLENWQKADSIKVGEQNLEIDAIFEAVRTDCRVLHAHEFSEAESKRFHLF